jgi:NTP pyrophosphatase (non-canonical NTP hydrolase)
MNPEYYILNCLNTESTDFEAIKGRIDNNKLRLLHAALGMTTEASEVADVLKKHLFYGKELDKGHLKEEIGDILYYCSIAIDALGGDYESIMEANIRKLKARFPEGFNTKSAISRNLDNEKDALDADV